LGISRKIPSFSSVKNDITQERIECFKEEGQMRVAKNVYAILDMFHPTCGVNAGFIVTKKHIVYVDSGWTIPSAQTLLGYSLAVAPKNKPKYVIFTDHHPDHIFGMKTLKEAGVKTVGHLNLDIWLRENKLQGAKEFIDSLFKRWFGEWLSEDLIRQQIEALFGDVELSQLDQTIDEDTMIKVDDEEIHVLNTPGHWKACLSVYLPSSRILFAGDTIFGPGADGSSSDPATRFGDKNLWRQWIDSLEKLAKLKICCIIPGHGRLCDAKEISRHITYLEELIAKKDDLLNLRKRK
jgi:glyoxylase-like metal-dependent hydrolase (beta-lactamase superfamily II)